MRFFGVTLSITAVILMFITGCENSTVTGSIETDVFELDELKKPIITNNEPPHLAREFDELVKDLMSMDVPDSAKFAKAWTLAFELSKYDGPMAQVFESLIASEDVDVTHSPVKDRRLYIVSGKRTDCEELCLQGWINTTTDLYNDAMGTAFLCGLGGLIATVLSGGSGALVIASGLGMCGLGILYGYYSGVGRADRDLDLCYAACLEA